MVPSTIVQTDLHNLMVSGATACGEGAPVMVPGSIRTQPETSPGAAQAQPSAAPVQPRRGPGRYQAGPVQPGTASTASQLGTAPAKSRSHPGSNAPPGTALAQPEAAQAQLGAAKHNLIPAQAWPRLSCTQTGGRRSPGGPGQAQLGTAPAQSRRAPGTARHSPHEAQPDPKEQSQEDLGTTQFYPGCGKGIARHIHTQPQRRRGPGAARHNPNPRQAPRHTRAHRKRGQAWPMQNQAQPGTTPFQPRQVPCS